MTSNSRIVVVGEALVDLVLAHGAAEPVAHPGGSPANVALGLARLGVEATLVTRLGGDDHGSLVRAHLERSGVTLSAGSVVDAPTSTALATLDASGKATYEFTIDWRLEEAEPLPGACVHTGSIAAVLEPGASTVRELVAQARAGSTISYDPNARPSLMGAASVARPRIEALVAMSDVVKISDEDLSWIVPDEDVEDVAQRWLAMGPAVVVVTRGEHGAYAHSRAATVDRPGQRVDVVDTVGAGDSFTAGLLDGLRRHGLLGAAQREALRAVDDATLAAVVDRAIRVSAITCSRPGADPPTVQELDAVPLF